MAAKSNLVKWGIVKESNIHHLESGQHPASVYLHELFGFDNYKAFGDATENDKALLAKVVALSGPHGYCLLKALEARKSDVP